MKNLKHVNLLTQGLKHVKIDQTKAKHVKENKEKSKKTEFRFLGTSIRAHTQVIHVHPSCMHAHAHAYTPRNSKPNNWSKKEIKTRKLTTYHAYNMNKRQPQANACLKYAYTYFKCACTYACMRTHTQGFSTLFLFQKQVFFFPKITLKSRFYDIGP